MNGLDRQPTDPGSFCTGIRTQYLGVRASRNRARSASGWRLRLASGRAPVQQGVEGNTSAAARLAAFRFRDKSKVGLIGESAD
jgi:hypothetical protein